MIDGVMICYYASSYDHNHAECNDFLIVDINNISTVFHRDIITIHFPILFSNIDGVNIQQLKCYCSFSFALWLSSLDPPPPE